MHPVLTQPRRPPDREEKIRAAARVIATRPFPHLGTRKHPADRRTLDRIRLKTPWLTVYPVSWSQPGAWQTIERVVTRFYLNRPATDRVFASGVDERLLHLTVDQDRHELVMTTRLGGQPMRVTSDITAYAVQPTIARELTRLGYLLDGETTYFPLTIVPHGLIADLSHAYTKADAVARDEEIRR